MLDANIKTQLKAYLERVTQPIEIVASLDDGPKSKEMLELLHDVADEQRHGEQGDDAPGAARRQGGGHAVALEGEDGRGRVPEQPAIQSIESIRDAATRWRARDAAASAPQSCYLPVLSVTV